MNSLRTDDNNIVASDNSRANEIIERLKKKRQDKINRSVKDGDVVNEIKNKLSNKENQIKTLEENINSLRNLLQ